MADDNNAQANQQPPQPNPDLKNLEILVGSWEMSGEVHGRVTFEWMEGGFFLIQHVDLEQYGQKIKDIEIIGYERPFGAEPSEEIKESLLLQHWRHPRLCLRDRRGYPHNMGRGEGFPRVCQEQN